MAELVKITSSTAEFTGRFDRPYVGLIADDRAPVFEEVIEALLAFKFRLANAEVISVGPLTDHKVIFRNPEKGVTFQFGAEEYTYSNDQSSWNNAEEDLQVLVAAEDALLKASGAKVGSCLVRLFLHMQPIAKTREQILESFVPTPFEALVRQRQALSFGSHLRLIDGDLLLDFSNVVANGIFLRLTSEFINKPPLADILAKVRGDQKTVFGILDIEDVNNG